MATGQSFSRVELLGDFEADALHMVSGGIENGSLVLPVCLTQREDRLARSTTCDRIQYGVFFTVILSRDSCCAGYWQG